jgi:outer membrane protein assembly factor BamA
VRFRLASVAVHAPAAGDSAALAGAVALVAGDVASPMTVGRALERALHDLTEAGHPYATLGVRSWEADSGQVRLGLTGTLGPRVTISAVRLEGMRVTRPAFAEKSMGRLRGQPYNRAAALAARDRLLRTGLFREVQFDGLEGESDWSRGQLVYRVSETRFNTFEGALGMQGPAGAAGLVRLDLGNLLGTGRALGFRWEAFGHGVSRLGARFAEPLVLGTPLRLEGSFDQNVQDTLFVRTRWGARGQLALSTEERVEAGYEEERVVQEQNAVTEVRYRTTSLALERVTLDHPLAPRRGTRLRFGAGNSRKTEQLGAAGQRVVRAGNFEAEGEWHRAVGAATGVALEIRGRGRFSSERVLPLYERLPLGGA